MGRSYSAPAWLSAREWLQAHARRVAELWLGDDAIDLLLTPTIAEPPPPLGTFDSPPDNPLQGLFRAAEIVPFTPIFNVTGQPAISLPLATDDAGVPVGVQLAASFGREDVLLRVAGQLERARPWTATAPV
jgi:amidase